MILNPNTQDAIQLFHEGSLVFSRMHRNGIRVDMQYCRKEQKKMEKSIEKIVDKIETSREGRLWRKTYGNKTSFLSGDQLSTVLYDKLGIESIKETDSGARSTEEEVLLKLGLPFCEDIVQYRKLNKVKNTYLGNFIDLSVDGYLHPTYNLNLVSTFRSSSSDPNFQNIPIRDPRWAKLLRTAFISRHNHQLMEIDYSGVEVRISACYHEDPVMIKYINGHGDMHKDAAADCFLLDVDEVTKLVRYAGKNKYVFPEFYGSYYPQVAKSLWEAIFELDLKTDGGMRLDKHLKQKGVRNYKQFEKHIKAVESDFWGKRFKVYDKWKKDFYAEYLRKGYFHTYTGFTCSGFMKRNEVVNYPIQGSAFHLNLKSIIMLQKILDKRRMKTKLIGQIHDSVIADVHVDEVDDMISIVHRLMTKRVPKLYDWIKVPIDIEIELCPEDGSWYDKKEVKLVS
jgi:DNA polymerase-1